MLITAFNPETIDLESSLLSNPYTAGVTSIQVDNNDRFVINDRILIGEQGTEKAEVVTVSAVSADGQTMTVGATVFSHSAGDPVYKLRFDQVKFYRSTTGSTGAYSVISTQNLDVDNPNLTTIYDDTTGVAAYYYKITMYHSVSTLESDYTDPIQGTGWRREQVGYIIDEILQEVSDQQELNVTRSELLGYFNDVNDDLTINVGKPYDFLHSRTTLTRTANTNYIDFPTDSDGKQTMWKFDRIDCNFTDTTTDPDTDITYTIRVYPPEEFRNLYQDNTIDSTTVDDRVNAMTLDTSVNRFRFNPPFETSSAATFYLHYWKYFDVINSEGDIVETPTAKIYKLYCKAMYYRKRGVTESTYNATADRYLNEYAIEKAKYKGVDRKDKGTPRSFRFESSTIKSFRR
jgi:hypothetical protein